MLYLKTTILLSLALFFSIESQANRNDALKFGKISEELVDMTTYDLDPDAEAVVLSHTGEAKFDYREKTGFVIVYKIHKVVKILKKTGLEYGEFVIPYYNFSNRLDNVSKIQGFVYNKEDGKVVKEKLSKEHIFDEQVSATFKLKKVTMPNIKEGSVVEISYEITSDLHHYFREWEFQTSIPTKWSEYQVEFPQYFSYTQTNQGAEPYVINEIKSGNGTVNFMNTHTQTTAANTTNKTYSTSRVDFTTTIYHWAVNNAPALRQEPYIDNPMSYATKVEFQLATVQFPNSLQKVIARSWESMSDELLKDEDFGRMLEKAKFGRDFAAFLIKDASTDMEKVKVLYDHVVSKIKWDGRRGIYASKSLDKVYQEGKGNMADINMILTVLLRDVGLEAHPVVSISRDRGFINPTNPVMYKLNRLTTCVRIDGNDLLLDATDDSLPFGMLGTHLINFRGWLVAPGAAARWVETKNHALNNETFLVKLKIADEKLQGEISHVALGYRGAAIRSAVKRDGEEKYREDFEDRLVKWELEDIIWENVDDRHANLVEKYTVSAKEDLDVQGNLIYIQPLENQPLSENPFKLDKRIFPVDFIYTQKRQYIWNLEVPDGYKVDELPQPLVTQLGNRAITYTYRVGQVGNTIQIMSVYQVNQTLFSPEEYPNIREFFDAIAQKQSEMIVLKKG